MNNSRNVYWRWDEKIMRFPRSMNTLIERLKYRTVNWESTFIRIPYHSGSRIKRDTKAVFLLTPSICAILYADFPAFAYVYI